MTFYILVKRQGYYPRSQNIYGVVTDEATANRWTNWVENSDVIIFHDGEPILAGTPLKTVGEIEADKPEEKVAEVTA